MDKIQFDHKELHFKFSKMIQFELSIFHTDSINTSLFLVILCKNKEFILQSNLVQGQYSEPIVHVSITQIHNKMLKFLKNHYFLEICLI